MLIVSMINLASLRCCKFSKIKQNDIDNIELKKIKNENKNDICTICMNKFLNTDKIMIISCNHNCSSFKNR